MHVHGKFFLKVLKIGPQRLTFYKQIWKKNNNKLNQTNGGVVRDRWNFWNKQAHTKDIILHRSPDRLIEKVTVSVQRTLTLKQK